MHLNGFKKFTIGLIAAFGLSTGVVSAAPATATKTTTPHHAEAHRFEDGEEACRQEACCQEDHRQEGHQDREGHQEDRRQEGHQEDREQEAHDYRQEDRDGEVSRLRPNPGERRTYGPPFPEVGDTMWGLNSSSCPPHLGESGPSPCAR